MDPRPGRPFADDRLHLRVLCVHRNHIDAWWRSARRCDPYWRLYVNAEAGASIVHRAKRLPLPAGRIVLVPAGTAFATVPAERPIDHLYLHFDLLGLSHTTVSALFPAPFTVPADAAGAELARLLHGLLPSAGTPGLLPAAKALAFHALHHLFASLSPTSAAAVEVLRLSQGDNDLTPALFMIEQHLADPVRVAVLAQACALPLRRFATLFQAQLGMGPARYLLERRLAAAAAQLRDSQAPIDVIAGACGFADRFHLSRAFSRRFGMGPAAYRRQPVA